MKLVKSAMVLAALTVLAATAVTAVVATSTPAAAGTPTPAAAPSAATRATIVWVDAKVSHVWHLRSSLAFVDQYTNTTFKLGRCRPGQECIVIREKRRLEKPSWAAVTHDYGAKATIDLKRSGRTMSYGQRVGTMIHEIGHARGIHTHTNSCRSVMYAYTNCDQGWGRVAPRQFTRAEKALLRSN